MNKQHSHSCLAQCLWFISDEPRILKVSEVGDFYRKKTVPRIRLEGKWLARAGIPPGCRVKVHNPAPGVLILHLWSNPEQMWE